jgi:hypothetical protein
MIEVVKRSFKFTMREDPIIAQLLGSDSYGRVKVYDRSIPSDVDPPSVRLSIVGGDTPQGHYGDNHGILNKGLRASSWGHNEEEAGQVHQVVWDFLDRDIDLQVLNAYLTPWYVMSLSESGDSLSLDDRETGFVQYVTTWELAIGR